MSSFEELARLGVATVHEAIGRSGVIDMDLIQILPGSRCAGPARTVRTGQNDNLMVHAALDAVQPGEVLVLTMPEPAPVALLGELIAVQAVHRGVAGVLVDGAVRDVEELRELGLPIWARWVRATGATKEAVGTIDEPVAIGGAVVRAGDAVILDADGALVVPRELVEQAVDSAQQRERREQEAREQYRRGALAYDLSGYRQIVERPRPPKQLGAVMPRLEPLPLPSDANEEIRRLFKGIGERGQAPSPLYRTLARAPHLLLPWAAYSQALRRGTAVDAAVVEVVVMRLAQLSAAHYQWAYHWEPALAAGLSKAQLRHLGDSARRELFDDRQLAALAYAESMFRAEVNDPDFARLLQSFTAVQALELTLLIGFYINVGRVLQALGIEVDPSRRRFLPGAWPGATADDHQSSL